MDCQPAKEMRTDKWHGNQVIWRGTDFTVWSDVLTTGDSSYPGLDDVRMDPTAMPVEQASSPIQIWMDGQWLLVSIRQLMIDSWFR